MIKSGMAYMVTDSARAQKVAVLLRGKECWYVFQYDGTLMAVSDTYALSLFVDDPRNIPQRILAPAPTPKVRVEEEDDDDEDF